MEAYHGIKGKMSEFLYAPDNFLLYTFEGFTIITWNPNTLKELEFLIYKGIISEKKLERKKWKIREVGIPDSCIRSLQASYHSNRKRKVIEKEIFKIFDFIVSEDFSNFNVHEYESIEALVADSDWWKYGEKPPF